MTKVQKQFVMKCLNPLLMFDCWQLSSFIRLLPLLPYIWASWKESLGIPSLGTSREGQTIKTPAYTWESSPYPDSIVIIKSKATYPSLHSSHFTLVWVPSLLSLQKSHYMNNTLFSYLLTVCVVSSVSTSKPILGGELSPLSTEQPQNKRSCGQDSGAYNYTFIRIIKI